MKNTFTGGWATFTNQGNTLSAIDQLSQQGYRSFTVHSPYPLPESADPQSASSINPIAAATFVGGITGCASAFLFMVWSTLDWILPLSAKPIVSIPVMIPIAFEVTVLSAIVTMILTLVTCITVNHFKHPKPASLKFKNYHRFTDDRFGIVVPCQKNDLSALEAIFKEHQAEEVEIES